MSQMTAIGWLFLGSFTVLMAVACWMAYRGMTAPSPDFREGAVPPGDARRLAKTGT
ncbi:MAG: hypothetical protein OEW11_04210 [Nitrospirota bacterium]|nr:hypothetical protein [Nitrospirota bacterium]